MHYGYRKDEQDRKKLVVDEEAAAVVRRIFALCAAGQEPSQIARLLKREQVLCPTAYAYKNIGVTHSSLNLDNPYGWSDSTIANMLEKDGTLCTAHYIRECVLEEAEQGTGQHLQTPL